MGFLRTLAAVMALGTSVLAAAGCGTRESPSEAQKPAEPLFKPIDPSQAPTMAEAPGSSRYWGILPCADCAGIRTELTLTQDSQTNQPQRYELTETHLGTMSQEEKPVTTRGRWSVLRGIDGDPDATVFALDGGGVPERARRFERLSDRELRQLDREGKRIDSSLNYVLARVSNAPAPITLAPGAIPPALPGGAAQPAAMVTDMASGWPVALAVGQEMTARLTADRATGARWALRAGSDAGIVSLQGSPTPEAPAGQAPVEVFRLRAVKPGKTTLMFDLKKGADAAIRSVSYPVTVQ